jgi:hypothetical protein
MTPAKYAQRPGEDPEAWQDRLNLQAFRAAPPAFLLISAKRKNHR